MKLFHEIKPFYQNYIIKRKIPDDMKIIFVGDYHSNIHCFIKHLDEWKKNRILGEDYIVEKNYMIVITGDLLDRGPYSIELLYLLILIILVNDEGKIVIIKGNHEKQPIYQKYGFEDELNNQLNVNNRDKLKVLVRYLPDALFITTNNSYLSSKKKWYMFCHGGITNGMAQVDNKDLEIKGILEKEMKNNFEMFSINESESHDLRWSDFTASKKMKKESNRGTIFPISILTQVLDDHNIISIISGHQDKTPFAFLPKSVKSIENMNPLISQDVPGYFEESAIYPNIKKDLSYDDNNELLFNINNNIYAGKYIYDMTKVACFILSAAVVNKFDTIENMKASLYPEYPIPYGILNLKENTAVIHLINTNFNNDQINTFQFDELSDGLKNLVPFFKYYQQMKKIRPI